MQDSPALDASTTSIMGSEPNIYDTKLTTQTTDVPNLKTHISDSEISRISEKHDNQNRIVFTLGEDTNLLNIESQKLVRISSNNQDEICTTCLDDNVKKICTEINEFCTTNKSETQEGLDIAKHIDESIDIAKYMERRSEIDNEDMCKNCEGNTDGVCDIACAKIITDVIVIPSAEAILDTGQTDTLTDVQERSSQKTDIDTIVKDQNQVEINEQD